MPFQDPGAGGPLVYNPASAGLVPVPTVSEQTSVNGTVVETGQPLLQSQAVPIAEAIEQASQAITVIPPATAPAPANLPQNANPGQWFMFASQPNYAYVMCSDNVYRGIVLIPVV
jgi:hypothetical protein